MHLHGQKQYFTVQPTILIEKTQPMVEKLRPEYGKTQINFPKLRTDFSKTQPLEFFKLSQIQLHCTKNKPGFTHISISPNYRIDRFAAGDGTVALTHGKLLAGR